MSVTQGLYQFGGKLYAASKGVVGDDRLFYASFDGVEGCVLARHRHARGVSPRDRRRAAGPRAGARRARDARIHQMT